jgi:aspartate/methionine/tyrosine aminotransferase
MNKKVKDEKASINLEEMVSVIESIGKFQLMVSEAENLKLCKEKINIQMNLFSAQFTLKKKELDEMQREINNKNEQIKEHQKAHEELREQIAKKYNLKKDWGYKPSTGEIHPDDILD